MGKTIGQVKSDRGIGGPPMLKGSSFKGPSCKIKVKELREAPSNFGSPYIIDLEDEVHGCAAWAVNMTNLRALAAMAGFAEDPDSADIDKVAKWAKGKTLTLYASLVNNPKTKQMTRSLFLNAEG